MSKSKPLAERTEKRFQDSQFLRDAKDGAYWNGRCDKYRYPKAKYREEKSAEYVLAEIKSRVQEEAAHSNHRHADHLNIFSCSHCGMLHIGTDPAYLEKLNRQTKGSKKNRIQTKVSKRSNTFMEHVHNTYPSLVKPDSPLYQRAMQVINRYASRNHNKHWPTIEWLDAGIVATWQNEEGAVSIVVPNEGPIAWSASYKSSYDNGLLPDEGISYAFESWLAYPRTLDLEDPALQKKVNEFEYLSQRILGLVRGRFKREHRYSHPDGWEVIVRRAICDNF